MHISITGKASPAGPRGSVSSSKPENSPLHYFSYHDACAPHTHLKSGFLRMLIVEVQYIIMDTCTTITS